NYNGALAQISPESAYVKIVQADDTIHPECVARMVDLAERQPTVGLVSSYWLEGNTPSGMGIPEDVECLSGREACRKMVLGGCYFLGSPTTVLYRAATVRRRTHFFPPGRYHEDTEVAFDILLDTDLGFIHDVLSFSRDDHRSITGSTRAYNAPILDHLIV